MCKSEHLKLYWSAKYIAVLTPPTYQPPSLKGILKNTYLEVSFSLRCFQRLSIPNVTTQLCHWRDNWYIRGLSIPVLSY